MDQPKANHPRLRASPGFALSFSMDGRPFVAKETEPYNQFWLSERDRIVLSMFSGRRGATVDDAIAGYLRLTGAKPTPAELRRLRKSVSEMHQGAVLISAQEEVSRYSARMVNDYAAHRPFPRELAELIVKEGAIGKTSRVLDMAGGPGDLSLALARVSDQVTLMELSRAFIQSAARRARQQGLKLATVHESCNRLIFDDAQYEAVTISQALHWLDDVLVCRGLCRCLAPGGSFFVVLGAFRVTEQHPLAYVFGDRSILGHRQKTSFEAQARALQKHLARLFAALDSPEVQGIAQRQKQNPPGGQNSTTIVPTGLSLFHQRRPLDLGYARAFLTPAHIAVTRQPATQFWADLERQCAGATPAQLEGNYDWAVLQFKRGGDQKAIVKGAAKRRSPVEIGYQLPPNAFTKPTVT